MLIIISIAVVLIF